MKTKLFFLLAIYIFCTSDLYAQSDYSSYLNQSKAELSKGNCEGAERNYKVYKELTGGENTTQLEVEIAVCLMEQRVKLRQRAGLENSYAKNIDTESKYDIDFNVNGFRICGWGCVYDSYDNNRFPVLRDSLNKWGNCQNGAFITTTHGDNIGYIQNNNGVSALQLANTKLKFSSNTTRVYGNYSEYDIGIATTQFKLESMMAVKKILDSLNIVSPLIDGAFNEKGDVVMISKINIVSMKDIEEYNSGLDNTDSITQVTMDNRGNYCVRTAKNLGQSRGFYDYGHPYDMGKQTSTFMTNNSVLLIYDKGVFIKGAPMNIVRPLIDFVLGGHIPNKIKYTDRGAYLIVDEEGNYVTNF